MACNSCVFYKKFKVNVPDKCELHNTETDETEGECDGFIPRLGERFGPMNMLYELLDATFRTNAEKSVNGKKLNANLLIEAPSTAGKSTIINQYSKISGLHIKEGNVTRYAYLKSVKDFKLKGVETLIHEDIAKISPTRELINDISYWHMFMDHHIVWEAFKPHVNEYIFAGLILTAPTGFIDGVIYESMTESGFINRPLHIKFDSSRDTKRLLRKAWINGNVWDTTIPPINKEFWEAEAEHYESKIDNLDLSGQQQTIITNLIKHGCRYSTVMHLKEGKIVF